MQTIDVSGYRWFTGRVRDMVEESVLRTDDKSGGAMQLQWAPLSRPNW